jgi:adhesin transport system outer membrane protein
MISSAHGVDDGFRDVQKPTVLATGEVELAMMSRNIVSSVPLTPWLRLPLLITGLWLGASALANAGSLEDAVRAAVSGDPRVSAADAEHRAAARDIDQARGGYFPRVDLNGSYGRERSNIKSLRSGGLDDRYLSRHEFGVSVSQMLYDGLFTRSEVENRRALLAVAGSTAEATREQIAFAATSAYLDVLRSRQLASLAKSNVKQHQESVGKVEQRRSKGLGTAADLSQAQARLALARSVLTARQGRLREAATTYKRLVGDFPDALEDIDVGSPGMLARESIDQTRLRALIDSATDEAIKNNPNLKSASAHVEAASAQLRSANSAFLPRLDLQLNVDRNGNLSGVSGVRNSDNIMLVGRWNLFNGGSDQAREKALAERRTAAQDGLVDTRRAIEERVAIAVQAKATSEERLQYLRAHVDSSKQTLKSYEAQFKLGRRSLLDTLNANNELFTARSNLVSGRYEDILNGYFIEASKGALLQNLGVTAGN